MKWYSTKEYKPSVTCTACFVRTKGGGIVVASNTEMSDGSYIWETDEDKIVDATHFCIPNPIPVEE